jgi:hypothetical protein
LKYIIIYYNLNKRVGVNSSGKRRVEIIIIIISNRCEHKQQQKLEFGCLSSPLTPHLGSKSIWECSY